MNSTTLPWQSNIHELPADFDMSGLGEPILYPRQDPTSVHYMNAQPGHVRSLRQKSLLDYIRRNKKLRVESLYHEEHDLVLDFVKEGVVEEVNNHYQLR